MTLPVVRGVQRGRLAPLAILTTIGLGLFVWFSPTNGQQSQFDEPIRAVSGGSTFGAVELAAGVHRGHDLELGAFGGGVLGRTGGPISRSTTRPPRWRATPWPCSSATRRTPPPRRSASCSAPAPPSVTPTSSIPFSASTAPPRSRSPSPPARSSSPASPTTGWLSAIPGTFPTGRTFGQYVPALTDDQAITTSDQGRIIPALARPVARHRVPYEPRPGQRHHGSDRHHSRCLRQVRELARADAARQPPRVGVPAVRQDLRVVHASSRL